VIATRKEQKQYVERWYVKSKKKNIKKMASISFFLRATCSTAAAAVIFMQVEYQNIITGLNHVYVTGQKYAWDADSIF
jgi:metal-responsive CopG/Arc/MetJ family transcriptional regulator